MNRKQPKQPRPAWAAFIVDARNARQFTQEDLARRMGVKQGTISNLEVGRVASVLKHINGLSLHLGLSPVVLLERMGVNLDVSPLARLPPELQNLLQELQSDEIELITRVANALVSDRTRLEAQRVLEAAPKVR